MRGKYSPTVIAAYMADQRWWHKYSYTPEDGWNQYDPDGYDSYGYDENEVDRAGNHETAYYITMTQWMSGLKVIADYNNAYDRALREWGFDGEKPVLRK